VIRRQRQSGMSAPDRARCIDETAQRYQALHWGSGGVTFRNGDERRNWESRLQRISAASLFNCLAPTQVLSHRDYLAERQRSRDELAKAVEALDAAVGSAPRN
jgi:hypothetical protein